MHTCSMLSFLYCFTFTESVHTIQLQVTLHIESLLMGRRRRRHLDHQNIFIGAIGGTCGIQCLHVNDVVAEAARCAFMKIGTGARARRQSIHTTQTPQE